MAGAAGSSNEESIGAALDAAFEQALATEEVKKFGESIRGLTDSGQSLTEVLANPEVFSAMYTLVERFRQCGTTVDSLVAVIKRQIVEGDRHRDAEAKRIAEEKVQAEREKAAADKRIADAAEAEKKRVEAERAAQEKRLKAETEALLKKWAKEEEQEKEWLAEKKKQFEREKALHEEQLAERKKVLANERADRELLRKEERKRIAELKKSVLEELQASKAAAKARDKADPTGLGRTAVGRTVGRMAEGGASLMPGVGGMLSTLKTTVSSLAGSVQEAAKTARATGKVAGGHALAAAGHAKEGNYGAAAASAGKGISAAIGGITKLAGTFAGMAGVVGQAVGAIVGQLGEMAAQMMKFVSLANPALVEMFTRAMDDAMAVLGKALTPFMEVFVIVMRKLGDLFASMLPIVLPITQSLAKWMGSLMEVFLSLFKALAPLLQIFTVMIPLWDFMARIMGILGKVLEIAMWPLQVIGVLFQALGTVLGGLMDLISPLFDAIDWALRQVTWAISKLVGWLTDFYEWVLKIFGLSMKRIDPNASASGSAVKQASYGSITDIGRRTSQAAFSLGAISADAKATVGAIEGIGGQIKKAMNEGIEKVFLEIAMLPANMMRNSWNETKSIAKEVSAVIPFAETRGSLASSVETTWNAVFG